MEEVTNSFIRDILSEAYTTVNAVIKGSDERKYAWNIVKTEDKKLISRFGEFSYESTTFVNKETCKNEKLTDRYLGISPHAKVKVEFRITFNKY